MSLRELPPGQKPDSGRLALFRYVPLVVLLVVVVVAALIGDITLVGNRSAAPTPVKTSASAIAATTALPEVCHEPVPAASQEPWSGGSSAIKKANAVWDARGSDLTQPYIAEKDGWYDWGDVQAANFSQAVGKRYLSTDEMAAWNSYLGSVQAKLAEMKIPFYIVVTPAKWDVYPQLLPDWAQEIRGSDSLDRVMTAYPDLPIVDVRSELRAASASNQTYSKTNSHWTDYGAWVGWKALSECLTATSPSLKGLSARAITGVSVSADRNEFSTFGVTDPAPNWTTPIYAAPLLSVSVSAHNAPTVTVAGDQPTDLLSLPASTTTDGAQTDLSALLVRDSFGNALSIPIQQSFAHTWQVRHNFDGAADTQPDITALAREHHPDVVILQIAERHLNFVPAG